MVASLPSLTPPSLDDLRRHGTAPALVVPDGTLTYADLADEVDAAAEQMTGDRQLVLIAGGPDTVTVATYLAAVTHGHTALMVPGHAGAFEALGRAYDPDVVLPPGATRLVPRRDGTAHAMHPDLALLLTTSGSTGSPKLVRLSRRAIDANAESIATYLGLDDTERGLASLPLHYSYGLSILNSHLVAGASVVLTSASVVDDHFWRTARAAGATSLPGVPHTFDLLDARGFRGDELPSLRRMTQAGGRMRPERVRQFAALGREHGWDLFVMYGQTEATARMAYLPPEIVESRPEAMGRAIPGGSLRLVQVPESAEPGVGELVYRGENVMMGYATSTQDLTLGPELSELRTGDLAVQDSDGIFTWVGRRARFAKVFGLRVDLDAIERDLADDGIEAACLDTGDSLALVVEAPAEPETISRRVAARCGLPTHAVTPHGVDAIPLTSTGKPDRPAMQAYVRERRPAGGADASVRSTFAMVLGVPTVDDDDTFVSLGGDSLSYVEMSVRLEELGLTLSDNWHHRPVSELTATKTRPRRWTRLDVSILLRAIAIVLIVGSHGNLWAVAGGAHLLLGVAGYNFARFRLAETSRRRRTRNGLASLRRVAVAAIVWIGGVALLTATYDPATALLLNGALGPDTWTTQWQFWFIEALVWIQLTALLAVAIPALHRRERIAPFAFAAALLLVTSIARYVLVGVEAGPTERYTPIIVAWCFALGWAAGVASTRVHRLIVSAATIAVVPGFFGDAVREGVVVAGVLLLVWAPVVAVPRQLARVAGVLAGASLYVYLTHWQVYPHFENWSPILALTLSLVAGIAYWKIWTTVTCRPRAPRSTLPQDTYPSTGHAAPTTRSRTRSPGLTLRTPRRRTT